MLPWLYRLYFWGAHGVFCEVVFTAVWEYVVGGGLRLMGESSLWSFLTYGLGTTIAAESMRELMIAHRIPTWLRCILYVPMVYVWEFGCGLLLTYLHACPWDYSHFDYDVMGLITMEYAPFWLLGGAYFELLMSCMSVLEKKPLWRQKIE